MGERNRIRVGLRVVLFDRLSHCRLGRIGGIYRANPIGLEEGYGSRRYEGRYRTLDFEQERGMSDIIEASVVPKRGDESGEGESIR